ncbi:MAG: FliA/WhiG family RNA polymerase sigma factor [Phycisphaeraceae bacterium]|nr:FliA/WhiG family RNA polymerase sigma factor [Phycisphaeraceae bacterium]
MAQTIRDLSDPQASLWRKYRHARTAAQQDCILAARNDLITHYLPLVRQCAQHMSGRLPSHVAVGDLAGQGVFGLMEAIDRFDGDRGTAFSTYARYKINSAILDYLRSIDAVTRLQRRRLRLIERARQSVFHHTGRCADEQELAGLCGLTLSQVRRAQREGLASVNVPMSRFEGDDSSQDGSSRPMTDSLADPRVVPPHEDAERRNIRNTLLRDLTRAEQLIVILYYYEGLSMREIGSTLDLSESRVSQMHSSILARLRARLADNDRLLRDLMTRRSA